MADLLQLAHDLAPVVAAGAAVVAAAIGFLNRRKVQEIEVRIDGRMEELLAATSSGARAEGVTQGEQAQRDRQAAPEGSSGPQPVTVVNDPTSPVPTKIVDEP